MNVENDLGLLYEIASHAINICGNILQQNYQNRFNQHIAIKLINFLLKGIDPVCYIPDYRLHLVYFAQNFAGKHNKLFASRNSTNVILTCPLLNSHLMYQELL